jgi:hypothetical protein
MRLFKVYKKNIPETNRSFSPKDFDEPFSSEGRALRVPGKRCPFDPDHINPAPVTHIKSVKP